MIRTIAKLCKYHHASEYFDDGNGLIGVYDKAGRVLWHKKITLSRRQGQAYSLTKVTPTPEGAAVKPASALDAARSDGDA